MDWSNKLNSFIDDKSNTKNFKEWKNVNTRSLCCKFHFFFFSGSNQATPQTKNEIESKVEIDNSAHNSEKYLNFYMYRFTVNFQEQI
jgi:hypothetical protein